MLGSEVGAGSDPGSVDVSREKSWGPRSDPLFLSVEHGVPEYAWGVYALRRKDGCPGVNPVCVDSEGGS